MKQSPDPLAQLEQRLAYRLRAFAMGGRNMDAEFSLPGLSNWMLSQTWPEKAPTPWMECLVVLGWSAICGAEAEPDREDIVRRELLAQLEYLDGRSDQRPVSLDAFRKEAARTGVYSSLRVASAPGSARRALNGLPRFAAADKSAR